jgi:hypothetical protein
MKVKTTQMSDIITATPADPSTELPQLLFENTRSNVKGADQIRRVLAKQIDFMELELNGRIPRKADCNGARRGEILKHLTELLNTYNYGISQVGKMLIKPAPQTTPESPAISPEAVMQEILNGGKARGGSTA